MNRPLNPDLTKILLTNIPVLKARVISLRAAKTSIIIKIGATPRILPKPITLKAKKMKRAILKPNQSTISLNFLPCPDEF